MEAKKMFYVEFANYLATFCKKANNRNTTRSIVISYVGLISFVSQNNYVGGHLRHHRNTSRTTKLDC